MPRSRLVYNSQMQKCTIHISFCMHSCMCTCAVQRIHARTHVHTFSNKYTYTRAHAHARTHIHTQTHTHTQMRELVSDFFNCRYARCLRSLDSMIPNLMLDMHLAEHVKELHAQVRNAGIFFITPSRRLFFFLDDTYTFLLFWVDTPEEPTLPPKPLSRAPTQTKRVPIRSYF